MSQAINKDNNNEEMTEKSIRETDTNEVHKVNNKCEAIETITAVYRKGDVDLRGTLEFIEVNGFTVIEVVEIFAELKQRIDSDSCIVFDCDNNEVERF